MLLSTSKSHESRSRETDISHGYLVREGPASTR